MLGQLAIEPAVLLLDARETLPQRRRISNLGRASKLFDRAPRFRVKPLAHFSVQGIECVRDSLLVVPAAVLGHLRPPRIGNVIPSATILLQVHPSVPLTLTLSRRERGNRPRRAHFPQSRHRSPATQVHQLAAREVSRSNRGRRRAPREAERSSSDVIDPGRFRGIPERAERPLPPAGTRSPPAGGAFRSPPRSAPRGGGC